MNDQIAEERKDSLRSMEKQLRLSGQKLDAMWMEARTATGQTRSDLHKLIGSLQKKQRMDRDRHEALKI